MLAGIAPSIGGCCYEVGEEILGEWRAALPDADCFFEHRDGNLYLDLWAANTTQLVGAGLPRERIELAGVCTQCHADQFFSYRAAKGQTGRLALLLGIRH
jgi:copper oxidase (laccase) domain-containing protein